MFQVSESGLAISLLASFLVYNSWASIVPYLYLTGFSILFCISGVFVVLGLTACFLWKVAGVVFDKYGLSNTTFMSVLIPGLIGYFFTQPRPIPVNQTTSTPSNECSPPRDMFRKSSPMEESVTEEVTKVADVKEEPVTEASTKLEESVTETSVNVEEAKEESVTEASAKVEQSISEFRKTIIRSDAESLASVLGSTLLEAYYLQNMANNKEIPDAVLNKLVSEFSLSRKPK